MARATPASSRPAPSPASDLAGFDLDRLRAYREAEVWGNAYRRPHRYGALVDSAIRPPFLRVDATGTPYDPASRQ